MAGVRKEINITTATTTTLIAKTTADVRYNEGFGVRKISVSNNEAQYYLHDVYIFLEDAAASESTDASNNKYYFINKMVLPIGVSLVLNDNLGFNKDLYYLRLTTVGTSPLVSVIIK